MRFLKKIWRLDKRHENNPVSMHLPQHIAFIMDGNGRWASKRGLPRRLGHREGAMTLRKIVKECHALGIGYVSCFALSTENWKRPKDEIDGLMDLLRDFVRSADKEIAENSIRIRFAMCRSSIPSDILKSMDDLMERTQHISDTQLIIAINYGGRHEMIQAAKKIAMDAKKGALDVGKIDETIFRRYLYLPDVPDPDLIIRPSGEKRISNFYLWQAAYSELWFSNVLWPDFSKKHLHRALEDYAVRNRRFGGL